MAENLWPVLIFVGSYVITYTLLMVFGQGIVDYLIERRRTK